VRLFGAKNVRNSKQLLGRTLGALFERVLIIPLFLSAAIINMSLKGSL